MKKDEKTSTVAIPDSAVVAYKTAVLDAFARTGKVTATWNELGVKRPALGDLPEGTTPAKVLDEAIARMHASGEVRASKSSRTFTYIPAKRFVDAVTSRITEVARTHPDFTIAASTVEGTESLAALAPSGWDIEPLAQMAIDMAVSSGVLIMVDGLARTKPAPEAVEPEPETSDTKPAGDTTSPKPKTEPEGTRTVAKTEGKVVETPETKVSETPVETAKNGVPEPEAPKSEGKAPAKRESVQVVTAPTPDMTPWLASIDGNIRHLTQILALPQASAREALSEGALLQSTLRRVMVLLERHGVLTNGELQRAFNGKLPAQREALEIALKYGVAVGALAATGAKNPKGWGARYTLADPTRVGIARHEILNEAMKKRTPKPKPKAS
ncbi:hypothetical protein [Mycobacteroides abscessus]|uniref:hypothetical protein n=1 Tax=Mycobacteroides abscessus TaxID=36809 RepID=UPI00092C289E|nr:hypothetical protein [Mycobacteroides abscessus]SHP98614.1 Uncharacterised protein [Mycobacteroides abscessus subsp. abscessus]SHQ61254.1 Uncharacterised protein [Mycobacteroides abscessus subsp. abscessus]SKD63411.1 Uncharacterised protein [Mycobacteroides abscessus subsp. abscessus]